MKESLSKLQNSIEHLLVELVTDIDYNHAISSSLQEYGIRMGKAIRKGIESQGIEPNLGDFMERYSTPVFVIIERVRFKVVVNNSVLFIVQQIAAVGCQKEENLEACCANWIQQ